MDDSFDMSEFKKKFPFPAKLDIEDCKERTKFFAKSRLKYYTRKEDSEFFDIVLDKFVNEYPLPAGKMSIMRWLYIRNRHLVTGSAKVISPLVENLDVDIGFVQMFYNENVDIKGRDTIGWFLGLVKPYDTFHMSKEEKDQLSGKDHEFLLRNMHYIFDDSMILLEGKLDDSVILQLKDYEKYYNKNILGKVVTGRPFSKETESIVEAARMAIKEYPLDKLLMIANQIGIPERTLQFHIKRSKYKSWKGLHDSVINNE